MGIYLYSFTNNELEIFNTALGQAYRAGPVCSKAD